MGGAKLWARMMTLRPVLYVAFKSRSMLFKQDACLAFTRAQVLSRALLAMRHVYIYQLEISNRKGVLRGIDTVVAFYNARC